MLYSFYRTRHHFKKFEREIYYICQNEDKQQAGMFPFSNFYLRIQSYIEANATYGKLWAYVITLSKVSEHPFFKEPDQQKQAKLNFDFASFFIACCSYYHKIRLASLKPQLPTHTDNYEFCVVIGIWTQLRNYQLSIKIPIQRDIFSIKGTHLTR